MQFFVHKNVDAPWPRAQNRTHFITVGIDVDLDTALAISLQEAVDFEIAEAVNHTKVVYGKIPKGIFRHVPRYWAD